MFRVITAWPGKIDANSQNAYGWSGSGHIPIVAGDIKAEYVGFTQQVGGQVIKIGHGLGI